MSRADEAFVQVFAVWGRKRKVQRENEQLD